MPESRTLPVRECDGCILCCRMMGIAELNKPAGVPCPNCHPGHGCRIYESRPGEYRTFHCASLPDEEVHPRWEAFVVRQPLRKPANTFSAEP